MGRKRQTNVRVQKTKESNPVWGCLWHPENGDRAPSGQMWIRNCMTGAWVLEDIGTPYTCTVASETYWSS